jgi:hypothetical protein
VGAFRARPNSRRLWQAAQPTQALRAQRSWLQSGEYMPNSRIFSRFSEHARRTLGLAALLIGGVHCSSSSSDNAEAGATVGGAATSSAGTSNSGAPSGGNSAGTSNGGNSSSAAGSANVGGGDSSNGGSSNGGNSNGGNSNGGNSGAAQAGSAGDDSQPPASSPECAGKGCGVMCEPGKYCDHQGVCGGIPRCR